MADNTLKLKFDINLKKYAGIAVASILWENEKIKHDIKDYFGDLNVKTKNNWSEIVDKVSSNANKLALPKELSVKMNDYITALGYLILRWNEYLRTILNLPPEFADKIYWTNNGMIDECKIFQLYWEKMPWFIIDNSRDTFYNHNIIALSCIFAQENYIYKNYRQIREITRANVDPGNILFDKYDTFAVIAVWVCIYFSKSKQNGINRFRKLRREHSVCNFLYFQCMAGELYEAAKYFWKKMDSEEKSFCHNCYDFVKYNVGGENCRDYDSYLDSKNTELLTYYVNEMPDDGKDQFLTHNLVFLFNRFREWPYKEILEKILDKYINAADIHVLEALFTNAVEQLVENHEKFVDKDLYRQILPKILENIPKEIKLQKIKEKEPPFDDIFKLGHGDASILITIYNDKDLAEHKDELIEIHLLDFKKLINPEDFNKLILFTSEVFPSKSERKEFMLKMNITIKLATEGQFCLADELLDWISDSEYERNELKDQIDPMDICTAKPNQYSMHIIKKFFIWRYDTEEEREAAKRAVRQNEFFISKMKKIMSGERSENREDDFGKWAEILFYFWNIKLS